MMEAMAMERVVIGTDIPGTNDLVQNRVNGMLVPIKSPEKIAEAVNYVLKNPEQVEAFGKNSRELIEEKFSASRAAGEYKEIYESLI